MEIIATDKYVQIDGVRIDPKTLEGEKRKCSTVYIAGLIVGFILGSLAMLLLG